MPAGDVFRARLILALADGVTYAAIKYTLDATARTISRWKQRFEEFGITGLGATRDAGRRRHARGAGGGLPQGATEAERRQHACGAETRGGVGRELIEHRILGQARLQPHRLAVYDQQRSGLRGQGGRRHRVYVEPPQHAAVFCVDEKAANQALDRLDTVLPLSPGRAERHGFEYYRHRTLSLYTALDVKTGNVQGKTTKRHTSDDFIAFLKELVASGRCAKEIQIVVDNLPAHKAKAVERSSPTIPRSGSSPHRPIPRG